MTVTWLLVVASLSGPSSLAAALTVGQDAGLATAAAASGRPPECLSGSPRSRRTRSHGPSVWASARTPELGRYCDLLARAQTELVAQPQAAREAALEAEKLLPGRPWPELLLGRASLALGSPGEAASAFDKALALDPRCIDDPTTLHDLGRTLARTGRRPEALAVYRALVPRLDLLGTAERRVAALLEAAHLSMTAEAEGFAASPADVGKPHAHLDEAVAYLREARQHPQGLLTGDVLFSLALVLDRKGEREQAEAVLAEAERTGARLHLEAAYAASHPDEVALAAIAFEGKGPVSAQREWESYLASPDGKGPWAQAARLRVEQLKRGGRASEGASDPHKATAKPRPDRRPR